ncbi:hypothetical protein C8A05DRAFT_36939 [Staphylotrichum tortipilum]|uniref:Uncharacterized protein n=1 Tax=Staphylotrichum tortipilum TaxID=2831512 RepID=A0AAN6MFW8_9PEZI|nr:hypothetical protein C8A05DRAFT_36939 [Staphylotrichum longicolle]
MSRNIRAASLELDRHLREIDSTDLDDLSTNVMSMSRWIEKTFLQTEMLHLAAHCAHAVYERKDQTALPARGFNRVGHVQRLGGGLPGSSSKPTTIGLYTPAKDASEPETEPNTSTTLPKEPLPYFLVVAIRGTASIHGWMVNLNTGARPGEPVQDTEGFLGKDPDANPYHAHAGFLASTKSLLPRGEAGWGLGG